MAGSTDKIDRLMQVRLLNRVAMTNPLAVTNCNIDLENLIADPNRSIATLAITTLLKTGSEGSVDRLLKQIGNFMTDIADEFKIVVVEAIRALCLKFPQVRTHSTHSMPFPANSGPLNFNQIQRQRGGCGGGVRRHFCGR
jgi:hypothetical protein